LNGKIKFFSEGDLVHPVLASAAVPGIFSPVEIEDSWYIDGGTMNNFPLEPLVGQCDFLIGSFVSHKKPIKKQNLTNTYKLVSRANELAILASSQVKFGQCDFLFNPHQLANYQVFDSNKVDEIYKIGYEYAIENMPSLLEIINDKVEIFSSQK
jgi:NTE family protein